MWQGVTLRSQDPAWATIPVAPSPANRSPGQGPEARGRGQRPLLLPGDAGQQVSKGDVGSGHPKTPSQPRQGAGVGSSCRVGCFLPLQVFSQTVCLSGRPPNQTHPHGSRRQPEPLCSPTPCSPNTGAKVGRWEAQLKSKSQIHSLKEKKKRKSKKKKKKNHDKTMCK